MQVAHPEPVLSTVPPTKSQGHSRTTDLHNLGSRGSSKTLALIPRQSAADCQKLGNCHFVVMELQTCLGYVMAERHLTQICVNQTYSCKP